MKHLILFCAILVTCTARPFRVRRQVTTNRLRDVVCSRQPTHAMCTQGDAADPPVQPRSNSAVQSLCQRNPTYAFCNRATQTESRDDSTPAPVTDSLCREYTDVFAKECSNGATSQRAEEFCVDYGKECSVKYTPRARQTLADPDELPFCRNYISDFRELCQTAVITQRYAVFCNDYSASCQARLGPVAGATPSSNVNCDSQRSRFESRCQQLRIAENDKQYCTDAYRSCNWRLGPATPTGGATSTPTRQTSAGSPSTSEKRAICKANEDQARVNCFQAVDVAPEHVRPCSAFVRDCIDYYEDDEPLRRAATLFNSRVGVTDGYGLNGIPFYPLSDGNLAIGETTNAEFGTWGGGASTSSGVGDFWELKKEAGANWYEGKYGTQNSWGVPLLPFIGGTSGTQVSVPINERTLGDPIGVNKGGAVGPFASWGEGTNVDWLNGNVGTGSSWGVPLIGLGGGKTSGVSFPSVGKFLPLLGG